MRYFLLVAALAACFGGHLTAAPARTLDRVTFTPPERWKVEEMGAGSGKYVLVTSASPTSYCVIGIYPSAPASSDLDASFASEWKRFAVQTFDPVPAPEHIISPVGNTRAAIGRAASKAGGQPAVAMLIVLDVGRSVSSILVLTPTLAALDGYTADVQAMMRSVVVAGAASVPTPATTSGGKLVIPPPTRTILLADLAGEWGQNEGINTRYVDRATGVYVGADSLHFTDKWNITSQGTISSDFFAIQNGRKIAEKTTGVVSLSANGILVIKMKSERRYVLRGWLETPNMTVMKLNGPWPDEIPADILANPEQGWNLDKTWVRLASPVVASSAPPPVAVATATGDGKLGIPKRPATIVLADLEGEWGKGQGINTRYVDRATGVYAGSESLHFTEKWVITSQGAISSDFFSIENGKKIIEETTGVVSVSSGILVVKLKNELKYVVRGWLETPGTTLMELNGPWEEIPARILADPGYGVNLDHTWVRLAKPK